jgi:hypothetical protein
MDRGAEALAENIPACDLDRRDDRAVNMAAVERHAVEHALGEAVDPARVLPDREMLQLVNTGLGGRDEAVQRTLADAVDAGVSMNLDEEPVLPARADREGFDIGDLHGVSYASAATVSVTASAVRP